MTMFSVHRNIQRMLSDDSSKMKKQEKIVPGSQSGTVHSQAGS